MARGQPPMRAAECLVPRAALDARRRRAIDEALRFAAPRVRELAWGSKLSEACVLRALLQTHRGRDECCVSPRGRLERPKLAEQLINADTAAIDSAQGIYNKQLRLSQDC